MTTVLKRFISVTMICIMTFTLMTISPEEANAATKVAAIKVKCSHNYSYWRPATITKVVDKGECYRWKALNFAKTASSKGEKSNYLSGRSTKVITSASIGVTVPKAQLEMKLGCTVEKTVSATIYGDISRPLAKGESCRFYHRQRWHKYIVTEKKEKYCKQCKKIINTKIENRTVKDPLKIRSIDFKWKYTKRTDVDKVLADYLNKI